MKDRRNKIQSSKKTKDSRTSSRVKKIRKTIKTRSSAGTGLTKHIKILGHGASPDGERFLKLRIRSEQGNVRPLIRLDDLTEGSVTGLNRHGAHLISPRAKHEFINRVQAEGAKKGTFVVATQLGHHDGAFVLPSGLVGCRFKRRCRLSR